MGDIVEHIDKVGMKDTRWSCLIYKVNHLVIDNLQLSTCREKRVKNNPQFVHTVSTLFSSLFTLTPQLFTEYMTTFICKRFNQATIYVTGTQSNSQ